MQRLACPLTSGLCSLTFVAGVAMLGACRSEESPGILQAKDLETPKGVEAKFDKNNIVATAGFTDSAGIDVIQIQQFFAKSPYDRPSFLETYQSNGVRASDAIARAARQYRLNPLVFLIFAQSTQGLVGERNYPFPPERVEYVFNCGCLQAGKCLPELAGFDRQVDCLGRSLKSALKEIAENGATAAGFGPDKPSATLDGLKVTPANEGTAAVYNRTPLVAEGKGGGGWIFWNLWNLYSQTLDYAGPTGGGSGGWIGDACQADGTCGYDKATCATNYPSGLCTASCTGACPSQPDKPEAFCVAFPSGGYCFPVCNPGAPACRKGYKCLRVARYKGAGANDSKHVCYPNDAAGP